MPNIERELKFVIDNSISKEKLIAYLLSNIDLDFSHQDLQTDVYWDTLNFDIINLKRGLRIRYVSEKIKNIEFKSLFKNHHNQFVVEEISLYDGQKLNLEKLNNILFYRLEILKNPISIHSKKPEQIFSSIGLLPTVVLKKERNIFYDRSKSIEISIDIIDNLGIFVEVEQIAGKSELFDQYVSVLNNTGFAQIDHNHAGYLDMLMNKNPRICSSNDFQNKFAQDNFWNLRPNEKEIVERLF